MKILPIKKVRINFINCLLIAAICCPSFLTAQWSGSSLNGNTYRNGRVGINESSLHAMLQIEAFRDYSTPSVDEVYYPFFRLKTVGDRGAISLWDITGTSNSSLNFSQGGNSIVNFSSTNFFFSGATMTVPNGKMSIGTNTLANHEQLSVRGGMITTAGISQGFSLNGSTFGTSNHFGTQRYGLFLGDDNDLSLAEDQGAGNNPVVLAGQYGIGFDVNSGKMAFCENGVLVIGGNSTNIDNTIADVAEFEAGELEYHLYVERGIRTERARVDLKTEWADYVFAETYELPKLTEVEQFITEHKHLPNVLSAAAVKANGIDVAEMDETLLRKIEELTLYTIEQQKIIEATNKELAALKAQIIAIQKTLEKSK